MVLDDCYIDVPSPYAELLTGAKEFQLRTHIYKKKAPTYGVLLTTWRSPTHLQTVTQAR